MDYLLYLLKLSFSIAACEVARGALYISALVFHGSPRESAGLTPINLGGKKNNGSRVRFIKNQSND
jgi:hypothetical protein